MCEIRDKASSRGGAFANYVKAVLSLVFAWGSERGYITKNPAEGIRGLRRKKDAPDPNRPWTDAEREAVLEVAPDHMRSAIALMMYTGLGPKDVLTLPRTFCRDGEIATRRSKTGQPVFWPVPATLAAILATAPKHDAITLCANSTGRPWTLSGFRASWRPVRIRLEAEGRIGPGLTLYGLRHTVAVILREMGREVLIGAAREARTPDPLITNEVRQPNRAERNLKACRFPLLGIQRFTRGERER